MDSFASIEDIGESHLKINVYLHAGGSHAKIWFIFLFQSNIKQKQKLRSLQFQGLLISTLMLWQLDHVLTFICLVENALFVSVLSVWFFNSLDICLPWISYAFCDFFFKLDYFTLLNDPLKELKCSILIVLVSLKTTNLWHFFFFFESIVFAS